MGHISENNTRCLLNALLRRTSIDNMPTLIVLELTRRCNLWCRMCRTPKWWQHLKNEGKYLGDMNNKIIEKVQSIIATAQGIYLSLFGEPYCNHRCSEIIREVRNINNEINILITSNFVLPTEQDLKTLIEQKVSIVSVSMDSPHKEKYEYIRVGANYDVVIRNLDTLSRMTKESRVQNPRVGFSFVVMKPNINEIGAFVRFALQYDPRWIVFHDVVPNKANPKEFYLTDDDYRAELEEFAKAEKEALAAGVALLGSAVGRFHSIQNSGRGRHRENHGDRLPCIEPWRMIIIEADGTVCPCCYYKGKSMGNVLYGDFELTWNGARYQQLRRGILEGNYDESCHQCITEGYRHIW